MSFDVENIRKEFPILSKKINGNPLVYFDNGASAQKPQIVLDAINNAYSHEYANVHRGLHTLSNIATDNYENTRNVIAKFLDCSAENVIFTSGATEGFNLIAYSWGEENLKPGDEVILSVAEHHANLVPWMVLAKRHGIVLKWLSVDQYGQLSLDALKKLVTDKTKLITITAMSNVTGLGIDVKALGDAFIGSGIRIAIDGSQEAVHKLVSLKDKNIDFYAITGHKLYGPTGSGALYVSNGALAEMRPFMTGGEMVEEVRKEGIEFATGIHRFEAGTPSIVGITALATALEFMMNIGRHHIEAHEKELTIYFQEALKQIDHLRILGEADDKSAIFTFTIDGIHPHDLSTILDQKGVAVRAGKHCAHILLEEMNSGASARASLALYNTNEEIHRFMDALQYAIKLLK